MIELVHMQCNMFTHQRATQTTFRLNIFITTHTAPIYHSIHRTLLRLVAMSISQLTQYYSIEVFVFVRYSFVPMCVCVLSFLAHISIATMARILHFVLPIGIIIDVSIPTHRSNNLHWQNENSPRCMYKYNTYTHTRAYAIRNHFSVSKAFVKA